MSFVIIGHVAAFLCASEVHLQTSVFFLYLQFLNMYCQSSYILWPYGDTKRYFVKVLHCAKYLPLFFVTSYNFFSHVYAYMCCLSGKTAIRQKFNCQTSEFVLGAKHSIRLRTNGGDADIHPLLDSFLPPSSNISWHLIEKERSNKQL